MFSWLKNLIKNFKIDIKKEDTFKNNLNSSEQIIQKGHNNSATIYANKDNMKIGKENTLIGDIPEGNYGDRNTIIRPGEGGIAIGAGAKAGNRSVSIGAGAGAGLDQNK